MIEQNKIPLIIVDGLLYRPQISAWRLVELSGTVMKDLINTIGIETSRGKVISTAAKEQLTTKEQAFVKAIQTYPISKSL